MQLNKLTFWDRVVPRMVLPPATFSRSSSDSSPSAAWKSGSTRVKSAPALSTNRRIGRASGRARATAFTASAGFSRASLRKASSVVARFVTASRVWVILSCDQGIRAFLLVQGWATSRVGHLADAVEQVDLLGSGRAEDGLTTGDLFEVVVGQLAIGRLEVGQHEGQIGAGVVHEPQDRESVGEGTGDGLHRLGRVLEGQLAEGLVGRGPLRHGFEGLGDLVL